MTQSSGHTDYDSFDLFSRHKGMCVTCKVETSQFSAKGPPIAWLYSRTSGIITGKWLEIIRRKTGKWTASCGGDQLVSRTGKLDIKPTKSRNGRLMGWSVLKPAHTPSFLSAKPQDHVLAWDPSDELSPSGEELLENRLYFDWPFCHKNIRHFV